MSEIGRPRNGASVRNALKQDQLFHADLSMLQETPPPPDELRSNYAREYWQYICDLKLMEKDLRQQWLPIIFQLCKVYELESELEAQCSELILFGEGGRPFSNPLLSHMKAARDSISRHLRELRLTPASVAGYKGGGKTMVLQPPMTRKDMT